jgi:hypothetical protein
MKHLERKTNNYIRKILVFLVVSISCWKLSASEITIYYYYDPITDKTTFTNRCHDFRLCKPLYESKGEVKHKKGYKLTPGRENGFDDLIKVASERYDIDFFLIKSVIKAESLFDVKAVSTAGAKGLMQLMPLTAKEVGVYDLFDAKQNINGGTAYLRKMLNRFKTPKNALAAYNAGPTAVTYYNGVPPFKETTEYVEKIANFYYSYTGKRLW